MPGVGWALWRDGEALPEDLVFHVDYLGGDMPTYALNFSRPGVQVVARYYDFLRLGFDGPRRVQHTCRDVATRLARESRSWDLRAADDAGGFAHGAETKNPRRPGRH